MDQVELKKLIALFEKSDVHELEIEEDGTRIHLKKEPKYAPVQVAPSQSSSPSLSTPQAQDSSHYVKAPLVGSFYTASNPNAAPYVTVGQNVNVGDVVCLIEAMKVMNEIKADKAGIVKSILVANADLVEFNQKLIEIGDA